LQKREGIEFIGYKKRAKSVRGVAKTRGAPVYGKLFGGEFSYILDIRV